jgi:hypothetical protein
VRTSANENELVLITNAIFAELKALEMEISDDLCNAIVDLVQQNFQRALQLAGYVVRNKYLDDPPTEKVLIDALEAGRFARVLGTRGCENADTYEKQLDELNEAASQILTGGAHPCGSVENWRTR